MKKKTAPPKRLAMVQNDPWLEPVEDEINLRYKRFNDRLSQIKKDFGSLQKFADAYNYFGINYDAQRKGWVYREWAPEAYALFLIGDFNDWDRSSHPMKRIEYGVWEIFLDENEYKDRFKHGSLIKVVVDSCKGWRERIPAYVRRVVQDDHTKNYTAQVWLPQTTFDWAGDNFDLRSVGNLLIYESHVGMAQEYEGVGSFADFTAQILPRIKNAGYNTVQIMALAEHPYYGSFGYHVSNFFAVSSRFGIPEDLKYLVREAHKLGLGVIMDIVHSHTVKNINEGLNEFDGSDHQYFHANERGDHPAWDSKLFDYGKTEVLRFLLSNIKFWLSEFHIDGYRFDGVTSMLYFHHGLGLDFVNRDMYFKEGVEFDAITYLQLANALIHEVNPAAISIAEDMSGMPGICNKIDDGGIGFDYRLAMGIPDYWIKLLKEKTDEQWNIWEMWNVLTNRLPDIKTIAYCESHDQALVGDKTIAFWLMDKEMYFNMSIFNSSPVVDRGLALHKMIRFITLTLGGQAYLNFMGNEFGHPEWIDFPREGNNWSYKNARRQWSLADREDLKYHFLAEFDRQIIHLCAQYNILAAGYGNQLWMDDWHKTIVFEKAELIFVFNFHINQSMTDYQIPVYQEGNYKLILNSDHPDFGGFNRVDQNASYPSSRNEAGKIIIRIYSPNRTALVFKKID